ncbi:MAG: hypothetical protein RL136_461 [Planctomycetota bacterium]|jgi:peroxiredoxin
MPLAIGTPAPAFALPSKPGTVVDLSTSIGREKLVILFFPLAFSSVCTAEMCQFRDDWSRWEQLGCRVIGVSVDSPFVTEKFREELGLPFPILSDFNKTASDAYGVLDPDLLGLKGVSKRAAFVVGSDGRIAYAWVADVPSIQVEFESIRAAVERAG